MVARQRSCLDFGLHVHFFSPFEGVSGPNRTAGRQVLPNDSVVVAGHPSGLDARLDFHWLSPFSKLLRFFPLSLTAQNNGRFNHPRVK